MLDYPEEYTEIEARTFLQIQLLMPQGNCPETGKLLFLLIPNVQQKLKSMLYHKENFLRIENSFIQTCIDRQTQKAQIPINLYCEFEAFLFQTKSALDITIKLLDHLFPNTFHVGTFHKKGKKLVANLKQYKDKLRSRFAKKINNQERLEFAIECRSLTIDNIISMLEDEKAGWLHKAINARDTISHFKGSQNFLAEYTVERAEDNYRVTLPTILDVHPVDFMEITYRNCIEFVQDFICLFIELWLPHFFVITAARDSDPAIANLKEAGFGAAKYIKYTLSSRLGPDDIAEDFSQRDVSPETI